MATSDQEAFSAETKRDKYRSFLNDEEEANTIWRHGGPPTYDDINHLFEQGRTKVRSPLSLYLSHTYMYKIKRLIFFHFIYIHLKEWPKGSLEETVQNAIKSWEMELSHKTRLQDFKTINPTKFKLIVNGTFVYIYGLKLN